MEEFEDIRHTGGKITFSNGQATYVHTNPFHVVLYDIAVSFNGIVLCRGDLMAPQNNPQPSVQVMIASDKEGFFGYTCPRCSKYFRASHGTAKRLICPYCLQISDALTFLTQSQKQYIKLYFEKSIEHFRTGKELSIDLDEIVSQLDNNIINLHKYEERQQRIISCEKCKLKFDVIGTYASCPKCGKRNGFLVFAGQIQELKQDIDQRNNTDFNHVLNRSIEYYVGLGSDLHNILKQIVPLCKKNQKIINKIDFQKIIDTNQILQNLYGLKLYPDNQETTSFLNLMFQRRHLIAHKGSIVDEKYLERTNDTTVRLGQKISIKKEDVLSLLQSLETYTKEFFDEVDTLISDYIEKRNEPF